MVYNKVKNYELLQGVVHPTDHGVRRDLSSKRISVENSGDRPISVRISADFYGDEMNFTLRGGETKFVAINAVGDGAQYITLHHPITKERLSKPTVLSRESNQFVLRDGINNWFVHKFHMALFNASH